MIYPIKSRLLNPSADATMRQTGFTLVEMTVVLLLITLMASVAVRETAELGFQTRYEQTQERLEMIRQAILGNPKQIINGQQAVSGFVADMGRLPVDLHELLEAQYCRPDRDINWANNPADANTVCNANYGAGSWVNNALFVNGRCINTAYTTQADCENNNSQWIPLGFGWHGPYLNVSGSPADADVFPDAWGRLAPDAPNAQTQNYGWVLSPGFDVNTATPHPFNSNRLVVQSYGKDQQVGGADYEADYPSNRYSTDNSLPYTQPAPLVDQEDWLLDISQGLNISVLKKYGSDNYCGFSSEAVLTTQQDCLNAGGAWSGTCSITVSSCKTVGGRWQSCFFSPSACASAGGASTSRCQFTEKSCNAADGNSDVDWNSVNHSCDLDSPSCSAAGGSWSGTECNFSRPRCQIVGGSWVNDCTFTSANCVAAEGTWESTTTPNSCSFTQTDCHTRSGQSTGRDCYMSHAEFSGTRYVAEGCQTAAGTWTARICMNLFYRNPNTSVVTNISSNPVTIDDNGAYQTINFNFTTPPLIPVGANAIGIYEYDGDCNLDNPLYPADRQNPTQVDFHPHTTLPVINW